MGIGLEPMDLARWKQFSAKQPWWDREVRDPVRLPDGELGRLDTSKSMSLFLYLSASLTSSLKQDDEMTSPLQIPTWTTLLLCVFPLI